jgi:glycosyltransferase involved in cell wall biosynthesis
MKINKDSQILLDPAGPKVGGEGPGSSESGSEVDVKVGIVHPRFVELGGAENVILWLAASLNRRGHQVTVVATEFSSAMKAQFSSLGCAVRVLPPCPVYKRKPWERLKIGVVAGRPFVGLLTDDVISINDPRAISHFGEELARRLRGLDLVNVHNCPAIWWAGAARTQGLQVPLLWSCNEPYRNLYPQRLGGELPLPDDLRVVLEPLDQQYAQQPDAVLCISDYVRQAVVDLYGRDDAVCVPLGIPGERPRPSRGDPTFGAPLRLLLVSRLTPLKNVENVVKALRLLPNATTLRLVGDGPLKSDLQTLAREEGVSDRVIFAGFLDDEGLHAAYRTADVFVFTPRGEPFGLVLVEAAAAMVPAVTSRTGGPAEIVVHGQTGMLVDPESPESIADGVRQALARRDELGVAAYERFHSHYRFETFVDRFLEQAQRVAVRKPRS